MLSAIAWWEILGWFAGGILTGGVFITLALYEERRAKKKEPPP